MKNLVYVYDKITRKMGEDIYKTGDKKLIEHWIDGWQRQIDEITNKDKPHT